MNKTPFEQSIELDEINRPLNAKEHRAVDLYLETGKKIEVARLLGISTGAVDKIFKKPHVKKEFDERQRANADRADITNEWLINEIKEVALAARSDKQFSAALKGLEMLAKINGLFEEAENSGITYNVMGSVILAPDEDSAQRLLAQPDRAINGEYQVMDFNVGD